MREREMSEKMKRLKMKMEVQEITFNYFARPQPRDLNVYVMMIMAIQKILSVVSKFVVGVCDGLDACEISRPEILPQSTPDYNSLFDSGHISNYFNYNETDSIQLNWPHI